MVLALEEKGEEAIQQFVDSLPSWPCTLYLDNVSLDETQAPKLFKALKTAGHRLNQS